MKESEYSLVSNLSRLRAGWEVLKSVYFPEDTEEGREIEEINNRTWRLIERLHAKAEKLSNG